jgi:hypothetical protein
MKRISIIYVLFCATAIFAQTNFTAISNLNQPPVGSFSSVGDRQIEANSFITDQTAGYLLGVSILLDDALIHHNPSSLGTFELALYSDAGGVPGSRLASLSGNIYPTNAGVYFYTNTVALALATNTTYWIVASNSDNSGDSTYSWSSPTSSSLDAGSIWALGVQQYQNGGSWMSAPGNFLSFSVTVAIPPPFPPTLSISRPIFLTFLATSIPYVLQENSSLATTNWVTVTNAIASGISSNQIYYVLPANALQMFYQLTNSP